MKAIDALRGRDMDTDAPYPRCPYCGLPMHSKGASLSFCALHAFECRACNVVLGILPQAEISENIGLSVGFRRDFSERKAISNP